MSRCAKLNKRKPRKEQNMLKTAKYALLGGSLVFICAIIYRCDFWRATNAARLWSASIEPMSLLNSILCISLITFGIRSKRVMLNRPELSFYAICSVALLVIYFHGRYASINSYDNMTQWLKMMTRDTMATLMFGIGFIQLAGILLASYAAIAALTQQDMRQEKSQLGVIAQNTTSTLGGNKMETKPNSTGIGLGALGLIMGALIGFLLRPSVMLIGQLPFETVISRGTTLQGLDKVLVSTAETSFNIMLVGAIIGAVMGVALGRVLASKKSV
jgi:hypothetical protein